MLIFILALANGYPRKHKKIEYERRRVIHHKSIKNEHKHELKHEISKSKHESRKLKEKKNHASKKDAHKVYKKFGMITAPTFALEDSSVAQGQAQPALQQVLVPVNTASFTQNNAAIPEMVSSFTAAPSQRATLGTEVTGDQSNTQQATQQVTTQAVQPQQTQTVQLEGTPAGTNEDNSVLKTTTQESTSGGTAIQEPEATQTELVGNPTSSLDAGSENLQSFAQPGSGKGTDEMKDLQVYTGPLPDNGQSKPQIEGVAPQEEVKVVNLGDDEKTASLQQDKACGGCPPGAKCVNGQCQIREEDAQAAGLTGKGTASNPGTVSDIHNLETQELTSLLKDASKADTPPTAVPESPTGSPLNSEFSPQSQSQLQEQGQSGTQQQKIQSGDQTVELEKPVSTQNAHPSTTTAQQFTTGAQQSAAVAQPHFTGDQLKELRDFARMYKMYQFIRKMEERLNDPDCAPICRKMCKDFCPAKCCHGQKVNTNVVSQLMQTANKIKNTGNKASGQINKQRTGMEDSGHEDSEEQDEKKMDNDAAGKKHILIKIMKNNELDKPRSNIAH